MTSPDAIRKRWCEILAQAHEAGAVDRRTLRIGAHCCFSQIGKDLARYDDTIRGPLLLQFITAPECQFDLRSLCHWMIGRLEDDELPYLIEDLAERTVLYDTSAGPFVSPHSPRLATRVVDELLDFVSNGEYERGAKYIQACLGLPGPAYEESANTI